eukprot:gene7813-12286_t
MEITEEDNTRLFKEIDALRMKGDWKGLESLTNSQKTDIHSVYYSESLFQLGKPFEGSEILKSLKINNKKETAVDFFVMAKISRLQYNHHDAFKYDKIAAKRGLANSQNNMIIYYDKGIGTSRNLHKSFFWMQKAAENNLVDSQFNCGLYFYQGSDCCEQNFEKSFYWFSRAAEKNDEISLFFIAEHYEKGRFIEKNLDKAYEIYVWLLKNEHERTRKFAREKVNFFQEEGLTLIAHHDKMKMYLKLIPSNTMLTIYTDVNIFTIDQIKH